MFDDLLERARGDIAAVRSVLRTNEVLRQLLFTEGDPRSAQHQEFLKGKLGAGAPDPTSWRVYDHSSGVTGLYAIYERCVNGVVKAWLTALPTLVPKYSELSENVRSAHRRGIARIIQNIDRPRFKHLTELGFVKAFHDAVSGASPYELLPEAFLFTEANFRKDTLESVLVSVAIGQSWKWITESRFISNFVASAGRGSTTPEAELRSFIAYRNDSAHGAVNDVLGLSAMLELADFVEALCSALCELAMWNVLLRRVELGLARILGETTERYEQPDAVIAVMKATDLTVGDKCVVGGESGCFPAAITSIQLNGHDRQTIIVDDGTELGLKFDVRVPKNRTLYKW
jgi:hypothetical protein